METYSYTPKQSRETLYQFIYVIVKSMRGNTYIMQKHEL